MYGDEDFEETLEKLYQGRKHINSYYDLSTYGYTRGTTRPNGKTTWVLLSYARDLRNKPKTKQAQKERHKQNKKRRNAQTREWIAENKENHNLQVRDWQRRHRDQYMATKKKYYEEHNEEISIKRKEHRNKK